MLLLSYLHKHSLSLLTRRSSYDDPSSCETHVTNLIYNTLKKSHKTLNLPSSSSRKYLLVSDVWHLHSTLTTSYCWESLLMMDMVVWHLNSFAFHLSLTAFTLFFRVSFFVVSFNRFKIMSLELFLLCFLSTREINFVNFVIKLSQGGE